MERICHELVQGSPEWLAFRLEHHGASEAAAMLGLSKKTQRNELLRMKHSGLPKEFSEWVQENILDHGHEVEALARPIVEEQIGEELYPATYSLGRLSASSDGLTMDDETALEHKQWNKELAAAVKRGELPDEHMPQCQQTLMVTPAKKVRFVVSDGTAEKMVWMEVFPDKAWQDRIIAGWAQFDEDLKTYQPPEFIPAAVAKPVKQLPALSIQVTGSIALVDNLKVFGEQLNEFIEALDMKPDTDQGFADAEQAVKTLKTAEERLEAAEASALAQTASIDEMRNTVKLYADQARTTRLLLNKMVTERKAQIRVEVVTSGRDALAAHVAALNTRLGKPYMPTIPADFAGVIKGMKTITSLRNAVDTELARAKIEANAVADKLQINLNALREHAKEYAFLFNDTATLVMKEPEFVALTIQSRIDAHVKERAAEVARIEAAAKEKAEREAREKMEAEAKAKAEAEAREKADAERRELESRTPAVNPLAPDPVTTAAPAPVVASVVPAATTAAPAAANTAPIGRAGVVGPNVLSLRTAIDSELAGFTIDELQSVLAGIRAIRSARGQERKSA